MRPALEMVRTFRPHGRPEAASPGQARPKSGPMPGPGASRDAPGLAVSSVHARVEQDLGVAVLALVETGIGVRCLGQRDVLGHHEAGLGAAFRSEERRVGKECRARWWTCTDKGE